MWLLTLHSQTNMLLWTDVFTKQRWQFYDTYKYKWDKVTSQLGSRQHDSPVSWLEGALVEHCWAVVFACYWRMKELNSTDIKLFSLKGLGFAFIQVNFSAISFSFQHFLQVLLCNKCGLPNINLVKATLRSQRSRSKFFFKNINNSRTDITQLPSQSIATE